MGMNDNILKVFDCLREIKKSFRFFYIFIVEQNDDQGISVFVDYECQFFGAAICVVGLCLMLLSDSDSSGSSGGSAPLLGDALVIAGTLGCALSNVGEVANLTLDTAEHTTGILRSLLSTQVSNMPFSLCLVFIVPKFVLWLVQIDDFFSNPLNIS
ncbi:hypothetical protein C5167_036694 [Papaver somniferum]|uniref:Uncharacterized protein n=1 Tax=Papaver somniferum TaxID=3469 RepID=A0A4Y7I4D2_PAPSO|nr:hypothetical protein C5167_036694 [Papaver somniferum]